MCRLAETEAMPIQIQEHHIVEFQRLYKKIYDEDISLDEAVKQCTAMVNLNEIVYRPITKQDLKLLKD